MAAPAFFSGTGVVGEGEEVGGLGEGHIWSVGVLGVACVEVWVYLWIYEKGSGMCVPLLSLISLPASPPRFSTGRSLRKS